MLFNLISNAIKFSPEEGTVSVIVKSNDLMKPNVISVEVRDTGMGMSKETMQCLFGV